MKDALSLLEAVDVKGMCHITGGGFIENIPRMIPDGLCASVDTKNIGITPIFDFLMHAGDIELAEMYGTFNMGIGFVIAVAPEDADRAVTLLSQFSHQPVMMGKIIKDEVKIRLCL